MLVEYLEKIDEAFDFLLLQIAPGSPQSRRHAHDNRQQWRENINDLRTKSMTTVFINAAYPMSLWTTLLSLNEEWNETSLYISRHSPRYPSVWQLDRYAERYVCHWRPSQINHGVRVLFSRGKQRILTDFGPEKSTPKLENPKIQIKREKSECTVSFFLFALYLIVSLPCMICAVITLFTPIPFLSALNSAYLSYYQYVSSLLCPLVRLLNLPEIRGKLQIREKVRPQMPSKTHRPHKNPWIASFYSVLNCVSPDDTLAWKRERGRSLLSDCVAGRVHYRISLFCFEFSYQQTLTMVQEERNDIKWEREREREVHKKFTLNIEL